MGRWLEPEDRTPGRIGKELRALLRDSRHRANAKRAQQEIQAMPGPEMAVVRIEQLI